MKTKRTREEKKNAFNIFKHRFAHAPFCVWLNFHQSKYIWTLDQMVHFYQHYVVAVLYPCQHIERWRWYKSHYSYLIQKFNFSDKQQRSFFWLFLSHSSCFHYIQNTHRINSKTTEKDRKKRTHSHFLSINFWSCFFLLLFISHLSCDDILVSGLRWQISFIAYGRTSYT